MLCNVTGLLYLPNGHLGKSLTLRFRRVDQRVTAEYLGAVVPHDAYTQSDKTGAVDFEILTGVYMMHVEGGYSVRAVVPDAATADIADCIDAAAIPDQPPVWYQQALNARDEAVDAADRAEDAADRAAGAVVADYFVATDAERLALSPSEGETAYVSQTGHTWKWQSGAWVDMGAVPFVLQSDLAAETDRAQAQERLARWRLANGPLAEIITIEPVGGRSYSIGWTGLTVLTGDGGARAIDGRAASELTTNRALYIDTTQEFDGAYVVTEAALNNTLQASFVTGTNFLLLMNRNGQVSGPLAEIGEAAQLQREKLSIADANDRDQFGLLRLVNVSGTGAALTADIPGPLSGVAVDGYIGWRMPTNNADPMTITFAGETYSVKDMTGADIPAGDLPFGTDVIARMRGDGTVRLVGRYSNPDLTTLTAIQNAAAAAPPTSEGELLVFNPATSTWVTMNIDEMRAPMRNLYDIDASGVAELAPQTIVRSADAAQQVTIANVSEEGMLAVGLSGNIPTLNGSGSLTLAPGAVLSMDYPPAGDIRILSDVAGTPYTARVKTARPYLSAAKAAADALLERYAGTLTARQRNAVRNLYAAFRPVLDQFLYLYVLASPAAPMALLNWAGDNAATPVASPTFVAGQGYTFNGTTQHLMTGKVWAGSPFGAADRMMMAVSVDDTINAATRAAISSGNSQIEANRSASSHGFRSAATGTDSITGSAAGGLIVAQRSDSDSFTALRNGKEAGRLYREGASTTMSYEHVIGAGTGAAGPTIESTHWAGTVQLAAAGNPLPEREWARINTAWVEYLAEIGA